MSHRETPRILIFDGGDRGSSSVAAAGWVKFHFKDSHGRCIYFLYSPRSLYLTVGRICRNRLTWACTRPETWRWPAVGRWLCGAAARAMRIKKPSAKPGAFLCWLGYWRRLTKICSSRWWGHCKNVPQRYPGQLCFPWLSFLFFLIMMGDNIKRECINIYVTGPLCCRAEIGITLQINYTLIKKSSLSSFFGVILNK